MAFLVRKLTKRDDLSALSDVNDIENLNADIPTAEFRTKGGTLSTWIAESLENVDDAVLAIAVTSSQITKMDVIIIDTELLAKNALTYRQTYAGQDIAIPDLQNAHYDILDISIKKLVNCTQVYQEIVKNEPEEEKYILRLTAGEVRDLLKRAIQDNRVDESKAQNKIRDEIVKLKAE